MSYIEQPRNRGEPLPEVMEETRESLGRLAREIDPTVTYEQFREARDQSGIDGAIGELWQYASSFYADRSEAMSYAQQILQSWVDARAGSSDPTLQPSVSSDDAMRILQQMAGQVSDQSIPVETPASTTGPGQVVRQAPAASSHETSPSVPVASVSSVVEQADVYVATSGGSERPLRDSVQMTDEEVSGALGDYFAAQAKQLGVAIPAGSSIAGPSERAVGTARDVSLISRVKSQSNYAFEGRVRELVSGVINGDLHETVEQYANRVFDTSDTFMDTVFVSSHGVPVHPYARHIRDLLSLPVSQAFRRGRSETQKIYTAVVAGDATYTDPSGVMHDLHVLAANTPGLIVMYPDEHNKTLEHMINGKVRPSLTSYIQTTLSQQGRIDELSSVCLDLLVGVSVSNEYRETYARERLGSEIVVDRGFQIAGMIADNIYHLVRLLYPHEQVTPDRVREIARIVYADMDTAMMYIPRPGEQRPDVTAVLNALNDDWLIYMQYLGLPAGSLLWGVDDTGTIVLQDGRAQSLLTIYEPDPGCVAQTYSDINRGSCLAGRGQEVGG